MFDRCVSRAIQLARLSLLVCGSLLLFRAGELARTASATAAELPATIREEIIRSRVALAAEVRATRSELIVRADRIGHSADSRMDAIHREVAMLRESGTSELRALSNATSAELRATGASVRRLTDSYAALPGDFKHATSQIWDCEANPDCLENRYVTLGRAVEGASRAVEQSAPLIASSVERAAANSDRATAESAVLMKNLAGAFKPLPWWLRLPLQVAVPAAQLATPLVIR
jgi:hypothetical protein